MRNKIVILACVLLFVASCGVSKSGKKNVPSAPPVEVMAYDMLVATRQPLIQLTALAQFELSQGGKSIKSKAEISMIGDSCIQISVRPFLGIEVFRAGISPDGVILLDRLNGQYCRMGDKELAFLGEVSSRQLFQLMQSLLTGSPIGWDFTPIRKGEMDYYQLNVVGNLLTVITQKGAASGYKQIFQGSSLTETHFESDSMGFAFDGIVEYEAGVQESRLIKKIVVKGKGLKRSEQVNLEVQNYRIDRTPSINLQVPKSYQSRTFTEVIESIK